MVSKEYLCCFCWQQVLLAKVVDFKSLVCRLFSLPKVSWQKVCWQQVSWQTILEPLYTSLAHCTAVHYSSQHFSAGLICSLQPQSKVMAMAIWSHYNRATCRLYVQGSVQ